VSAVGPGVSLVEPHLDLFKLDWLRNPPAALEQGRAVGISDPHFVEMSAWCAELHAQLAVLAAERDMPLLLMGGNATALRIEASKQRGSRDNDYLTTASEGDIRALMEAFVARFEPHFDAPLFRYRQLVGPPDAESLPLAAFAVDVPAMLDRNATGGRLSVKLEFHIESVELFPDSERVSGRFFALGEDVTARIPKLPYQIGLKLMTLHEPPVGIDQAREDDLPRQLYDLDVLLAQLKQQKQWDVLIDYARRRYVKEEDQRQRTAAEDGPWPSIGRRLDDWSQTDALSLPYGQHIRAFQASQVAAATKRPMEHWRGRARRLQFAVRSLAAGPQGYKQWRRALRIETRIDEPAGAKLKAYRTALAGVTGIAPRRLGQFPRVPYWEHLALAGDVAATLDELDKAL
jgi:Nucleotidyl transferase AbiEii toxin, Type IV TA system